MWRNRPGKFLENEEQIENLVKAFAYGLINWTYLDLSHCELSSEVLRYFVRLTPKLRSLKLAGSQLTDNHLTVLAQVCRVGGLPALNNLDLGEKQNYTGEGLRNLAVNLPDSLACLEFYFNGSMSLEHIKGLLEATRKGKLASLRYLCLGRTMKLGSDLCQQEGKDCMCELVCKLQR